MTGLSDDVLATRRPVWQALSALWLDTELDEDALAALARDLAASPYALDEIDAIHRHEVAPVLYTNLLDIAGEWAGFDAQWLETRCAAHASRRAHALHRLRVWCLRPLVRSMTSTPWTAVRAGILALRADADADAPR